MTADLLERPSEELDIGYPGNGFVYCIWNPTRNTAKIGFTTSPARRFQQLKTACCDPLIYWAHFPGNRITEEVWHEALDLHGLRRQGEWFDTSNGLILKEFLAHALTNGGARYPS